MGLRAIELFAGAGGGCLATQHLLGFETVCYVEREPYAVDVLKARIADGLLHDAPIWDDVRTFPAHQFRGRVDVVCGGFPCQPFSVAGKGRAADDDRNGWPATRDIIRALRPRFAYLENVPGLLAGSHGYFGHILGELAEAGYDAEWGVLSAQAVGAPHVRKRLWILAHTDTYSGRCEGVAERDVERGQGIDRQQRDDADGLHLANAASERRREGRPRGSFGKSAGIQDAAGALANADNERREERRTAESVRPEHAPAERRGVQSVEWWNVDPADAPQSELGRVADGLAGGLDRAIHDDYPGRRDRLKALGNGQVPLVAAAAWHLLREG